VRTLQGRPVLARDCTPEMIVVVQTVGGAVQAMRADRDWKGGAAIDGAFVSRRGEGSATSLAIKPTTLRKHAPQGRATLHVNTSGNATSITLDWGPSVKSNVRRVLQRMLLQLLRCELEAQVDIALGTITAITADRSEAVLSSAKSFLSEHDVEVQVERRGDS
jgi:hypothetical protein